MSMSINALTITVGNITKKDILDFYNSLYATGSKGSSVLHFHTMLHCAFKQASQMLSLPEDWDYTLAGLSQINREKIDAIREAVRELERAGYIVRSRKRVKETDFSKPADYIFL